MMGKIIEVSGSTKFKVDQPISHMTAEQYVRTLPRAIPDTLDLKFLRYPIVWQQTQNVGRLLVDDAVDIAIKPGTLESVTKRPRPAGTNTSEQDEGGPGPGDEANGEQEDVLEQWLEEIIGADGEDGAVEDDILSRG